MKQSQAIDLKNVKITDPFWKKEMELVRTEVIPYQWDAINDRVKDAEPSYAMHNFRQAKALKERMKADPSFIAPIVEKPEFAHFPAEGEDTDGKFFGWVFQDSDVYKWMEAVSYSLIAHPDQELQKTVDEVAQLIVSAQADDGYLDTYFILNGRDKEFTNMRDYHELYCFGHLVEGSVAYYEATGNRLLLDASLRYAAYIRSKIGREEGKKRGYPGHEIAEMALVRLYQASGDMAALELAKYFIDERGTKPYYFDSEAANQHAHVNKDNALRYAYYQAHLPVREQEEAMGHAVRAMYLYSGMTDIANLTDDEELYAACEKLARSVIREKMYITGGVGATHFGESFSFPFDLPNDTVYAETCASIGLMFFLRRMLEHEANSVYADAMERALYNTVLSGMALDGKSFFYVNPLEVLPEACHKDENKHHVQPVRQKWFGCACCPPNLARLLGSVGAYAYTEAEDTLFVHLFMSSTFEKKTENGSFTVSVNVEEKADRKIVNISAPEAPEGFRFAIRLPEWADSKKLLSGTKVEVKNGYLYATGKEISVELEEKIHIFRADSRVRELVGKAAIQKGPVVYTLEEADNGKDLHLLSLPYGLTAEDIAVDKTIIAGNETTVLKVPGKREKKVEGDSLYFTSAKPETEDVTLTYIPYYMWANRGENEMQVWSRID